MSMLDDAAALCNAPAPGKKVYVLTIFQGAKDHMWYWRIKSANHHVVADGAEGYHSRGGAINAARRLLEAKLVLKVPLLPAKKAGWVPL